MKLTISEIKEKCEKDDQVSFKGTVNKVWGFTKKESKYSIGYQNIIVEDSTGTIKVIFSSIKSENEVHTTDIEGKEVEVSGKVSLYNNDVNIFGKLKFPEGEEQRKETPSTKTRPGKEATTPTAELCVAGITEEEIRLKCLALAIDTLRGENYGSKEIVQLAEIYEKYTSKPIRVEMIDYTKKEDKPKGTTGKPKEEVKKEQPNGEKLSQEHIKQINLLMALAENRGPAGKELMADLVKEKGYSSVKDFGKAEIERATKDLEQMGTDTIPF